MASNNVQPQNQSNEIKFDDFEIYKVLVELIGVHETHQWTRFNTFLFVNSLFALALVQLATGQEPNYELKRLGALILCGLGAVRGLTWGSIGRRISIHVEEHIIEAKKWRGDFLRVSLALCNFQQKLVGKWEVGSFTLPGPMF